MEPRKRLTESREGEADMYGTGTDGFNWYVTRTDGGAAGPVKVTSMGAFGTHADVRHIAKALNAGTPVGLLPSAIR
jgi:hypothetical protein